MKKPRVFLCVGGPLNGEKMTAKEIHDYCQNSSEGDYTQYNASCGCRTLYSSLFIYSNLCEKKA